MELGSWSDTAIAQGLQEQNPQALEAIIGRYSRELFYFIRTILKNVGSAQDVEECVSDLFVTIWQEAEAFDAHRSSFRTWLTMRAKYIALDRRRALLRRQANNVDMVRFSSPSDQANAEQAEEILEHYAGAETLAHDPITMAVERQDERQRLEEALEALPELDRKLIYLRFLRLASTEEIMAATGLSRHVIDNRIWRARKHLRVALKELSHERI